MILWVILALISIPVLVISCTKSFENSLWGIPLFASAVVFAVSAAMINPEKEDTTPTALDVYRGKTTLEITYRDSVAIDSTVVYKVK